MCLYIHIYVYTFKCNCVCVHIPFKGSSWLPYICTYISCVIDMSHHRQIARVYTYHAWRPFVITIFIFTYIGLICSWHFTSSRRQFVRVDTHIPPKGSWWLPYIHTYISLICSRHLATSTVRAYIHIYHAKAVRDYYVCIHTHRSHL